MSSSAGAVLQKRELIARIGQKAMPQIVSVEGEALSVEIAAAWADPEKTRICVTAVANGSSHWRLERLEEKITLTLSREKNA